MHGGYQTNTFCGAGTHNHTLTFYIRNGMFLMRYNDFVYSSLLDPDLIYDDIDKWTPEDAMKFDENIKKINDAIESLTNFQKSKAGEDNVRDSVNW